MPTTTGFRDIDNAVAIDIATKFVTKEYLMEFYPDLVPAALTPFLWVWGANDSSQLANPDAATSSRSSPYSMVNGTATNWRWVACGQSHMAAIKTDGTLWAWGLGTSGQLGAGNSSTRNSPVTTSGGGTTWRQVAAGFNHTTAVKTDGTLWCWGINTQGQLGDNTSSVRSSPVTTTGGGTIWKQVSAGQQHTAAVKTDGTLWGWGATTGDGTTTSRSSPVTTTGGGTTWKQVACGYRHTAAVKTDGTLWTWGTNTNGELGDNTSSGRSSPVTTTGGGTTWKQVAGGRNNTAAIKTDGTLWCWGFNGNGSIGDNTSSVRSSPVTTAAGGTNWYSVAMNQQTAGIKTDGTLWCWGRNLRGQVGDNSSTNPRLSPVSVVGGGRQGSWKRVACGYNNTAGTTESEGW